MKLSSLPLPLKYVLGLLAVGILGYLDYITGTKLAFFGFYLIPIIFFTSIGSLSIGITLSIASALMSIAANTAIPGAGITAHIVWQASQRLIVFLFCSYFYWKERAHQRLQFELVHYIVHDLRSPMTSALFAVEALKDDRRGELNKGQRVMLESAQTSMLRLATLTDAILDLASLRSGKAKLHLERIPLRNLFIEATNQLMVQAAQKEVAFDLSGILPEISCRADKDLTLRVAINLLSNALKASPKGTTIRAASTVKGHSVICLISDEGRGIGAEDLEKLFMKESAPNLRTGGGFGLRFCRQAILAHKGRIWAESKPGEGTTVFFSLPR